MPSIPIVRELSLPARVVLVATLLVSAAAILLAGVAHASGTVVFLASATGILGLAWFVGAATERVGALAGPNVGAIVNATFGNVAELIIAFFALEAGLTTVVKASLTGSIIGNLLLALGASLAAGGARHGTQYFSARIAGSNATMLAIAVIGLFVPAVFAATSGSGSIERIDESILTAIVLVVLYVAATAYRFRHPEEIADPEGRPEHAGPPWGMRAAVGLLLAATALLAVLAELLVDGLEPFVDAFGLTPFFVGVIVLPVLGNLAEELVAVRLALQNRVDFAMGVAIGSSLQVALFVAPLLVLAGAVIGVPMDLVFAPLEVAAVAVAVGITALIALDGESNVLEGALLLGVFTIVAVSFFFYVPAA
jgi:Ca2+:H+ antiporter